MRFFSNIFTLSLMVAFVSWPNAVAAGNLPGQSYVDPVQLEKDLKTFIPIRGFRNHLDPETLNKAADHIKKCWKSHGLKVSEQPFEVNGKTYKNILAYYGAENAPRIVVGAHYDVAGSSSGADDNASGVTGLLTLSRLLAKHKPSLKHRVDLVAFTLEEPPYFRTENMGSHIHAASLKKEDVPVKFMINLEMIGYFSDKPESQNYPDPRMKDFIPSTGNFIALIGTVDDIQLCGQIKTIMETQTEVPIVPVNLPSTVRGIDFSDHMSYWNQGFTAVMVTDTAFYRNRNYHQPTDTPDTLDYRRMADVIEGIYAVIVSE